MSIRRYLIEEFNVYGLILNIFSTPIQIMLILALLFLITQNEIITQNEFKKNLIIKFKNKKKWILNDCFSIVLSGVVFSLIIVVFNGLIGIANLDCSNKWTIANQLTIMPSIQDSIFQVTDNALQISPLISVILSVILLTLFLITLGLFIRTLSVFLKNKAVIFAITILINLICMFIVPILGGVVSRVSFVSNVLLFNENWSSTNMIINVLGKIFYWIILIGILYYVLNKLTLKKELISEEKACIK